MSEVEVPESLVILSHFLIGSRAHPSDVPVQLIGKIFDDSTASPERGDHVRVPAHQEANHRAEMDGNDGNERLGASALIKAPLE